MPVLTTGKGEIAPRGSHRAKARKTAQDKSTKYVVAYCDQSEGITLPRGDKVSRQWDVG